MKIWEIKKKQTESIQTKNIFADKYFIKKILIFQVFNDLSVSRKWKKLKIIKCTSLNDFLIIGMIPNSKHLRDNLEIFLPIVLTNSVLRLKYLFNPNSLEIFKDFLKNTYILNLAFIDRDSSIVYYKFSSGIKKTIGPFA